MEKEEEGEEEGEREEEEEEKTVLSDSRFLWERRGMGGGAG